MNPFDFLTLAKSLRQGKDEASWRTSISRSYYAVFHFVRSELSNKGVPMSSGPQAHGEIRTFLANCGVADAESLSSKIGDLHEQRLTADYKLNHKPSVTDKTAETVLLKASEVWSAFQVLDKNMVAAGIQSFRAKNNY